MQVGKRRDFILECVEQMVAATVAPLELHPYLSWREINGRELLPSACVSLPFQPLPQLEEN